MSGKNRLPLTDVLTDLSLGFIDPFKDEFGAQTCTTVSVLVAEVLSRFGYRTIACPVNALIMTSAGEACFSLGAYSEALRPLPGGTEITGFETAAHVVNVVKEPRLLIDMTLDQVNDLGSPARGLTLPPIFACPLPGDFPIPPTSRRLSIDDDGHWMIQYDWLAEDRGVLHRARLDAPRYDRIAADLRDVVTEAREGSSRP